MPAVNWLLIVATLSLTIAFEAQTTSPPLMDSGVAGHRTDDLPAFDCPARDWGLPLLAAIAIGVGFATIEGAFLSANMLKFADGGWVPVLLAIVLFALMRIWQMGSAAVQAQGDEMQLPVGDLVAQINNGEIWRLPGTAVFVARITRDIPPLVVWHLRHIRALHDTIAILTSSPR